MPNSENYVSLRAHRGTGAELFDTFIAAEALQNAFFKVQVTPTHYFPSESSLRGETLVP